MPIAEGELLWEPSLELKQATNVARYMRWLGDRGHSFAGYDDLWRWSVEDLEGFWASIWEYHRIRASHGYSRVLSSRKMPAPRWFEGAELNFAEHALRHEREGAAIVFKAEGRPAVELSWPELRRQVAVTARHLRDLGVGRGDRVAAYLPNMPEAVIAFLATASLGAIWSSCSPDFGIRSVVDRLRQIEPKVLLVVDGYRYGGREFDRLEQVALLRQQLPSLEQVIVVPYLGSARGSDLGNAQIWDCEGEAELSFEQVPFEHPLWVLYTSGTTGKPKGIVHSHGGILLGQLASLDVQLDLRADDRFCWFTTTGWVMWNIVVSSLLVGATPVLYDGSAAYPGPDGLWALAAETGTTILGASAAYVGACAKAGVVPGRDHDLSRLRAFSYTGSPLVPELWGWVYSHVKQDFWMSAISGGTDVCTAFVGGLPILPVRAGEFQCRCLGAKVEAWDEKGRAMVDQVGELVVTEPMPSMPVSLWNDPQGTRYRESYFSVYPGVWRHGDWIKVTKEGAAVIYGRSDATINRMGVRIGSSDIYGVVEELPQVLDSLVVDLTQLGRDSWMPLFVVLKEGEEMRPELEAAIRARIRTALSPRHVPDAIFQVPEIPRTLNSKKLELPVRKILLGVPVEEAVNQDSMSNPGSLDFFVQLAARLEPGPASAIRDVGGSDANQSN